ncbi:trimeric intracellular cation channel family protein [Pseudarthrobacter sp. BIM B-2242]|uniref:trimeric intracellular cation channel family protein n=1 Tax=Pseudarthrobacter sp. BIM B-2242 TaxID=2772401 RepID=UPI00168BAAB5|nr:trimeric intracellular cation channel family protein [Pseudarthrobacter sp. BIM B-2242]QOD02574.1 trimeric intracellular cation channel family protein [Pseudarthrobacter sp. BIM B-2242]
MTFAFDNAPVWLDLLGVFFFAVSGSLLAARKNIDIVGSLLLASLVGLGGGVIRDLILDAGPPAAFSNPAYLVPPLLATVLVYFLFSSVQRFTSLLTLFDAGGLALFCMTGTVKALAEGMNPVAAVLLGVMTAVGGGLLRDVTANEVPDLFNPRDIYALPAFAGAALTAVLWVLGAFNVLTAAAIAAVVFTFRVVAWRRSWQAPLAVHGRHRRPLPKDESGEVGGGSEGPRD